MPTVLITGASDGIGRALVDRYLADGWEVIAHGRRPLADVEPSMPGSVDYVRHDLRDGVDAVTASLPDALDLAILNAGVGFVAPPGATDPSAITELVQVNTIAPLRLAHALHSRLAAGRGRLVLIGSTASRGAHGDFAVYAATKAALAGAARSLRLEWDGSVDVQVIHPGPTATGMHERAGLPETWHRRFFTPAATVADAISASIESGRASTRFGLGFLVRHALSRGRT
ncbi:MAG: SDR family NAD(P)-dependent oxidoreductase [Ilumatobacter sp.]